MTETAVQIIVPSQGDRREAHDLIESLQRSQDINEGHKRLIRELSMSPGFARFLTRVLEQVAAGHTVRIGSLPEELTTTVAARELSVSRMTLMKWIREGRIPAHKVGTHTRLMRDDVLAFRAERQTDRKMALRELLALEDELDLH